MWLIVLVVLRFGLGALFALFSGESEFLGAILRYVRYVSMVLWAVWLAPWAFVKLRLA